ncbi:MAG: four helix bundle protein [Fimbriimonadaceae bacterium]|nr:four helix bundle protein [Fimbriimonadaceae bacterium]
MIEPNSKLQDLHRRTKGFAIEVVRLYSSLPNGTVAQIFGKQAVRSGASVGAHYREGYRARSTAEFISKLEVALQELEETCYWHELLVEAGVASKEQVEPILTEAGELTRIFVASVKKAKERKK